MNSITLTNGVENPAMAIDTNWMNYAELKPILTRIYTRVKTMSKNHVLMSNGLMKKAVNYLLNQWHKRFK